MHSKNGYIFRIFWFNPVIPNTTWKVFKFGVLCGPYITIFGLKYVDLLGKSPYSVAIRENTDQKEILNSDNFLAV